jgi:hypothetical protein
MRKYTHGIDDIFWSDGCRELLEMDGFGGGGDLVGHTVMALFFRMRGGTLEIA